MAGLTPPQVVHIQETVDFHDIRRREQPAVFKFGATWCKPSGVVADVYQQLSVEYPGVGFYDIDIEAQPELKSQCGIDHMPTFIAFKRGERVGSAVGSNPGPLRALVQQALNA